MGQVKTKIDCCGSNFENTNITVLGLLTLSTPLIIFTFLIYFCLFPLGFLSIFRTLRNNLKIIGKANLKLVGDFNLLPALRCSVAAFLVKFSPRFSRFSYNSFNLFILASVWISIGLGVTIIV